MKSTLLTVLLFSFAGPSHADGFIAHPHLIVNQCGGRRDSTHPACDPGSRLRILWDGHAVTVSLHATTPTLIDLRYRNARDGLHIAARVEPVVTGKEGAK